MLTEIARIGHWVDLEKLDKDSIVVDAGAGRGEFIEKLGIDCHYIAIEPNPSNANNLFDKAEVFEAALVGRSMPKEMIFYNYPQWERGNLFNLYPYSNESYSVSTITLDEIFNRYDKIDFLKLDIEGAEKDLIETMTQEDADKIEQICMEVHSNSNIEELKTKLEELGFDCQIMPRSELYACHSDKGR